MRRSEKGWLAAGFCQAAMVAAYLYFGTAGAVDSLGRPTSDPQRLQAPIRTRSQPQSTQCLFNSPTTSRRLSVSRR